MTSSANKVTIVDYFENQQHHEKNTIRVKSFRYQLVHYQLLCNSKYTACHDDRNTYMAPCDRHLPLGGVSSEEGHHFMFRSLLNVASRSEPFSLLHHSVAWTRTYTSHSRDSRHPSCLSERRSLSTPATRSRMRPFQPLGYSSLTRAQPAGIRHLAVCPRPGRRGRLRGPEGRLPPPGMYSLRHVNSITPANPS